MLIYIVLHWGKISLCLLTLHYFIFTPDTFQYSTKRFTYCALDKIHIILTHPVFKTLFAVKMSEFIHLLQLSTRVLPSPQVIVPSAGWNGCLQLMFHTAITLATKEHATKHPLTFTRNTHTHTKEGMPLFVTESVCCFRTVATWLVLLHCTSIQSELRYLWKCWMQMLPDNLWAK